MRPVVVRPVVVRLLDHRDVADDRDVAGHGDVAGPAVVGGQDLRLHRLDRRVADRHVARDHRVMRCSSTA
ncbi:hypothetical protein [Cellulomonas sp. URHB0016]